MISDPGRRGKGGEPGFYEGLKVPKSHRYVLTARGNQLTAAISAARNATIKQLMAA